MAQQYTTPPNTEMAFDASKVGYMADDYGDRAWRRVFDFLMAEGHTPEGASAIMLSKHMRWADDAEGQGRGRKTTFAAFVRYYRNMIAHHGTDYWTVEGETLAYNTFGDQ